MNKNITPIILLILSVGIYFTFTRAKIDELKAIDTVNDSYKQALDDSYKLIEELKEKEAVYESIDPSHRERLDKMLPNNVDNVRLIIDVNGVAARHGLSIKNVKTSTPSSATEETVITDETGYGIDVPSTYEAVTLSFNVSSNYQTFINFLKDIEASLRIMDVSRITLSVSDTGIYDYGVEIKTYWLK